MASIEQDDIFNVQSDDMIDDDDNQEFEGSNGNGGGNTGNNNDVQDSDGDGDDSGGEGDDSGGEGDDSGGEGDTSGGEGDSDNESSEEEQDNNTQDIRDVDDEDDDEEDDEAEDKRRKGEERKEKEKKEKDRKEKEERDQDDPMDIDSTKLSPRETMIAKAKLTTDYDIIPSVSLPYYSQCQSIAFTEGPQWILTGGEDGFIRKYDFISTIQGTNLLTTNQRQNLVDSITKAGVLNSYWENEQPLTKKELMAQNPKIKLSDFETGSLTYEPKVNPVYALEAEKNGFWCLSGLSSGGIALYTMRHNEGAIHHYFNHSNKKNVGHNDAISVLKLNQSQDKFISGSWDKSIKQWDLQTGNCITSFTQSSGQISTIKFRPQGLTDLSISTEETLEEDGGDEEDVDSLFGDSDEDENDGNKKQDDKQQKKPSSQVVSKVYENDSTFMSSSIDGTISIWDVRVQDPVIRFGNTEGVPPWCMSATWSNCGDFIYAGRRNSTVEELSLKMPHKRSITGSHKDIMIPNILKTLTFPKISGPVSALATMPNNNFILCGSTDNIRLYNLNLHEELGLGSNSVPGKQSKKQATPFLIIPGHQGGILSCLHVDETGRFMVSASGNRGWGHANYTETVLIYEIDFQG